MKYMPYVVIFVIGLALSACEAPPATNTESAVAADSEFEVVNGVKTKNVAGFGGVIAESYQDSEEWWAPYETPNADAPNVIIFLLDDVGFAQVGSFGGLIEFRRPDRNTEYR